MLHESASWAERGAYLFAGVAVVGLTQAAVVLTCISDTALDTATITLTATVEP